MIVYKERLLKKLRIKIQSVSCQCWSLYGFHTAHFMRHHLKLLCCLIGIWALRLPFLGQDVNLDLLLCTDSIWKMLFCCYALFLLRDQWMIERLSKAISAVLVSNNLFDSQTMSVSQELWLSNYVSITRAMFDSQYHKSCVWLSNYVSITSAVTRAEPVRVNLFDSESQEL